MYAVEVDTLKGNDLNTVRVFIHTSSGEMQKITNNVTVNLDDPKCFNYEVYAKVSTKEEME